jgi:hypothetical protein
VLPWNGLPPGLLLPHLAGDQRHDVVEDDEVHAADLGNHLLDRPLAFGGVEWCEILDIFVVQSMKAGGHYTEPLGFFGQAFPE